MNNKHKDVTNTVDADAFKRQVKLPICVIYTDWHDVHAYVAETEFDFVRHVLRGLAHSDNNSVRLIPVEYAHDHRQDMEDSRQPASVATVDAQPA